MVAITKKSDKKTKLRKEETVTTLEFENWGPIYKGTLEIKPFTILIGPNNTGKSYSIMTYYAIVNGIKKVLFPWLSDFRLQKANNQQTAFPEDFRDMITQEDFEITANKESFEDAIEDVMHYSLEISRDWVLKYLYYRKEIVTQEIERVFSRSIDQLIRFNESSAKLKFTAKNGITIICNIQVFRGREPEFFFDLYIRKGKETEEKIKEEIRKFLIENINTADYLRKKLIEELFFVGVASDFFKISQKIDFENIWSKLPKEDRIKLVRNMLAIFQFFTFGWMNWIAARLGNIFYLPASRSGILQGHKVIASSLVSTYPLALTRGINIPRFPGYVADFLSELLRISEQVPPSTEKETVPISKALLLKIEKEILQGDVKIKKIEKEGISEMIYRTSEGKDIPISLASSMISEMAPLYLYLKYVLNRGDTLIIEEPESHLHPDLQMKLSTILANLVNKERIHVIVTTHSDVLISKINTLITLSQLPTERRQKLGYADIDALDPVTIGAYLYTPDESKRVKIEKLEITEKGIPDDVFLKIIETLYDESMNIYHRLQKHKAKNAR